MSEDEHRNWHVKQYCQLDMDAATKPLHSTIEQLTEALQVILKTTRTDEKSECWTIREYLDKQNIFNDDMQGRRRLVEEVCKHALGVA